MKNQYTRITLRDLVNYVSSNAKIFPKGLDTIIVSGDFEGNYTHEKHEIQNFTGMKLEREPFPNAVCLTYEMHEGQEWQYDE